MLQCALPFEGGTVRCGDKITELMVGYNLLTPNNRGGVESAWRDYQQVLSEFGLIYSTRISDVLALTDLGHMYVAGSIGYSELMSQQVLRYQYPNGQKYIIQSGLRKYLQNTSLENAQSVVDIQNICGVFVKPGVLVLHVLLELLRRGQLAKLTVFECRKFLLPSLTNLEWEVCVDEIIDHRKRASGDDRTHWHANRNIQDWFKFLDQSDIFSASGGEISLSATAMNMLEELLHICRVEEDTSRFWVASDDSKQSCLSWFEWFGQLSLASQPALPDETTNDPTYIDKNFVRGLEDADDDDGAGQASSQIVLSPLDLESLGNGDASGFKGDANKLLEAMLQGFQKRQAKAILHDQIVKEVGFRLQEQGATISCGHGSIDLFAEWKSGERAMFEVKTVTKRSIQSRIRSAIGQLQEYQYRQVLQGSEKSDLIIAINSQIDAAEWQSKFVTDHMSMGILCKTHTGYIGAGHPSLKSMHFWANI